jgi:integrase/recombinase XerD
LWSYSANNEGKHPVKIRITYQRKRKYYNVLTPSNEKLFLSQKEFDFLSASPISKLRNENRLVRQTMDRAVEDATKAIQEATHSGKKPFSFDEFEKKFLGTDVGGNFLAFFKQHIDAMEKRGQAGNVRTYQSAYSAFKRFQNGRDFDPLDLTIKRLEAFEQWLKTPRPKQSTNAKKKEMTKPLNATSIGIYMRCIRAVYNELAMSDEYLKANYPFSVNGGRDKKYLIPIGGGQKGETLDEEAIKKFIDGKVDGEESPSNPMYKAKLLFLFSLYGQGINPVDIAHLRYENLTPRLLVFERRKTIRTRTEARQIEIPLIDQLGEIIVAIGNSSKGKREYIFEVFENGKELTPKEKDDTVRQWVKVTNKWLKRYCKFNGLSEFSLYSARHTFASLSKVHMSLAQISKMLGHSRITTTQTYLGRFDRDQNEKALQTVFGNLKKTNHE